MSFYEYFKVYFISLNLEKHLRGFVQETWRFTAILKIKQKFLFGIIINIHFSLTMQKEILEILL